jgi:peptidoglycan glycosyltransferase
MERSRHHERFQWLTIGLLAAFLGVALMLSYWGVVRSAALSERQDNPRRVEAELRIRRGRILDSEGRVLAETTGPSEAPVRIYPQGNAGPAIGFYSFRHGTAGVEEGFDAILRGDSESMWERFWRHHLHEAQQGRDIRVTINGDRQRAAEALLGTLHGAVVLLSLPDGAISAMVSHPGYDPNSLDEEFETLAGDPQAPLFNRVTQGQYQPGMALQPFLVAGALDMGVITLSEIVTDASRPVALNGRMQSCAAAPPEQASWRDVLQLACPNPMVGLGEALDTSQVVSILRAFGLADAPELPLAVAAPSELSLGDLTDSLIGQGELTVSPMQIALALGALGNEGLAPSPVLVTAVQSESGAWESLPAGEPNEPAVSALAASQVLEALPRQDGIIAEFATSALAGPAGSSNSWYLGLAPAQEPRYAVVVVVENATGANNALVAGRTLLNYVMSEVG